MIPMKIPSPNYSKVVRLVKLWVIWKISSTTVRFDQKINIQQKPES